MDLTKKHNDNFDFIRLFAASMVIISHTLGDKIFYDPLQLFTGYMSMGTFGVFIFFLISGYLITMNLQKGSNLIKYYNNRFLRIFPALIVVILFTIFILGPVFTNLSLADYFLNPDTYKYFFNLTLIKLHYTLPGVFLHNGIETKVNPPLWTLVFEFMMYILISVFAVLGFLQKEKKYFWIYVLCCLAVMSVYFFATISIDLFFIKISVAGFIEFFSYFFLGSLYFFFRQKIKIEWWMVLILGVAWYFSFETVFFKIVNLFFIASLVFYVAFLKVKIGNFITRHGDFSYGMYLYGSISSNIILHTISDYLNPAAQVILSLLLTIPFAIASWYLIESRALKYKK